MTPERRPISRSSGSAPWDFIAGRKGCARTARLLQLVVDGVRRALRTTAGAGAGDEPEEEGGGGGEDGLLVLWWCFCGSSRCGIKVCAVWAQLRTTSKPTVPRKIPGAPTKQGCHCCSLLAGGACCALFVPGLWCFACLLVYLLFVCCCCVFWGGWWDQVVVSWAGCVEFGFCAALTQPKKVIFSRF